MQKKYDLAILFTQPPFGSAISREGLDALLAASAFCEEDRLAICFVHDGVYNLCKGGRTEQILQKDHLAAFKLIELYDLSECFICQQSVEKRQLNNAEWLFDSLRFVSNSEIFAILNQAEKVLTF
ncbi:MAG: sulfurtransferase complex subunit TusC [Pasteurellaceae bacterium]|nr:sulfurtransferase complex subunit TusC [Pasteurellaceae bacterium]